MRIDGRDLLLFFGCACAVIALGAILLRRGRALPGWIALAVGLAAVALLALEEFTGRFGPRHLWFREPTFYLAALVLLGASWWWLTRPAPRSLRFGLPAALLGTLGLTGLMLRLDGHSAPLAMLMPTLDQAAPDFSYVDDHGQVRRLSQLGGKVVLLNFWATWCAPCRQEMPLLSSLQREHAADGLVVLYVSLEEPDVLGPFLATHRFDGIQGRVASAPGYYDAGKFYPLSYLIGRDGRVTQRWSGRQKEDWLRAELARALSS